MAEKTLTGFDLHIQNHLTEYAAQDELFAKALANPKKTLDGCCAYIIDQVKKSKRNAYTNDEIFGFARHYYDEADIKEVKRDTGVRIVSTGDDIATDAEKSAPVINQSSKPSKTKKAKPTPEELGQTSLFDSL